MFYEEPYFDLYLLFSWLCSEIVGGNREDSAVIVKLILEMLLHGEISMTIRKPVFAS